MNSHALFLLHLSLFVRTKTVVCVYISAQQFTTLEYEWQRYLQCSRKQNKRIVFETAEVSIFSV